MNGAMLIAIGGVMLIDGRLAGLVALGIGAFRVLTYFQFRR